jgi:hypothetical protein
MYEQFADRAMDQDMFSLKEPITRLEQQFLDFHRDNPNVYQLFCRFTQMLLDRHYEHHSSDAVLHRIRWATTVETNDPEFKINNNYSAYYARLWMRDHPEHDGFFRLRVLRNEDSGSD